jgi:FkbM family methyltransferase
MHQDNTHGEATGSPVTDAGSKNERKTGAPNQVPLWSTRYGLILANQSDSPLARSLKSYGEWVEQELDIIGALIQEGQVVLEYGAELGAHALWLSKMVGDEGQVHVVEPRRLDHIALCSSLALNRLRNVYPLHARLGASNGDVELAETSGQPPEATRQVALDSLKLDKLHLIKVSQSGELMDMLSGAEKTMRDQQPAIYFRLASADMATKEIAALKARNYRCWSHLPYLYNADNFCGNTTNIFPGWVSQNIIAVHRDKAVDLSHLPEL